MMGWPSLNAHRRRQLLAVARGEAQRARRDRGFMLIVVLSMLPVIVAVIRSLLLKDALRIDVGRATSEIAVFLSQFHLPTVVFFVCALVMVRPLRSEVSAQTLHLSLLAPIRRDVLILGKFLGVVGLLLVLMEISTVLAWLVRYAGCGVEFGLAFTISARGLSHLAGYSIAVAVAVVGYGALFFTAGIALPRPMLAVAAYFGLEATAGYLPDTVRILSIRQLARSFLPTPSSQGGASLLRQPLDPWIAFASVVFITVVCLAISAFLARRLEITYGPEDE